MNVILEAGVRRTKCKEQNSTYLDVELHVTERDVNVRAQGSENVCIQGQTPNTEHGKTKWKFTECMDDISKADHPSRFKERGYMCAKRQNTSHKKRVVHGRKLRRHFLRLNMWISETQCSEQEQRWKFVELSFQTSWSSLHILKKNTSESSSLHWMTT